MEHNLCAEIASVVEDLGVRNPRQPGAAVLFACRIAFGLASNYQRFNWRRRRVRGEVGGTIVCRGHPFWISEAAATVCASLQRVEGDLAKVCLRRCRVRSRGIILPRGISRRATIACIALKFEQSLVDEHVYSNRSSNSVQVEKLHGQGHLSHCLRRYHREPFLSGSGRCSTECNSNSRPALSTRCVVTKADLGRTPIGFMCGIQASRSIAQRDNANRENERSWSCNQRDQSRRKVLSVRDVFILGG